MKCPNIATHAYVWPGRDIAFACEHHGRQIVAVGKAIDCNILMIPFFNLGDEKKCDNIIDHKNHTQGGN